ncbi:uncharacterized protein MONBRDRAFT_18170 [Monosiga brevicollis MX1]|uniref:UDP-N-acetylglucosamine--dolichyl-phosphate N-acetylglucosaminephosphotransferase n=1 Tax=Monosiga brevicollis TaxID=81824 RepID=A9UUR5_MONBE|nr:uncharacterized protein MONBRDRAFT_18170 [Monosiga brevicollis MX1]EDQ90950.1 predicted protein [Monosiga brevicollis MX1]|eukprot:XP_001744247.1 hypothetical protein [Monosiga brevicollis MX1]
MALLPWYQRPDNSLLILGSSIFLLAFAISSVGHYLASLGLAFVAASLTFRLIPAVSEMFIKAGLSGIDLNKHEKLKKKVPEAIGVVAATIYLIVIFLYIPFHFRAYLLVEQQGTDGFPHDKFVAFICGLLSICCMIFLGFADDVLNLAWRHKLLLPTLAALPLLIVYKVTGGSTTVILPIFARPFLGHTLDLGVLFYIYMGMLSVFCTNAINILAGVNGIEAGQSLVIAVSLVVNSIIQIIGTEYHEGHQLALCLLMPFCGVTAALLWHNWYPSNVFVGDTFCYFAGITFAVTGILGHFSKTLLLFLMPQIFNFVFSVPQLFKLIPCPRHRLPKYDQSTGLLTMSYATFATSSLSRPGRLVLDIVRVTGLCHVRPNPEQPELTDVSNFTIINLVIKMVGPIHEEKLTTYILMLQVASSVLALAIRYPFGNMFFDQPLA